MCLYRNTHVQRYVITNHHTIWRNAITQYPLSTSIAKNIAIKIKIQQNNKYQKSTTCLYIYHARVCKQQRELCSSSCTAAVVLSAKTTSNTRFPCCVVIVTCPRRNSSGCALNELSAKQERALGVGCASLLLLAATTTMV